MPPLRDDVEKARVQLINRYIRVCTDAYLLNISKDPDIRLESFVNSADSASQAIRFLQSEYRKSEVIDTWNPLDIALFIAGVTRFGRDWESVKAILPHRSAMELSQFYYSVWKGSKMYFSWKKIRKQRGLE
jgi:hypothetical protein